MPMFDLLTEPWIPVLDAGTDLREHPDTQVLPREVGLREALVRAHELREVAAASPLQTVALYRLLLALALDVYQPEPDEDTWAGLWRAGHFYDVPFDHYMERWGERFDLLHPERPFFQRAEPDVSKLDKNGNPAVSKTTPLAKLFMEEASDNNTGTLFSHHLVDPPRPKGSPPRRMPLAAAARGVVVAQAYQYGGGNSKPFNYSDSLLIGRLQFWIRGRSLFEALLLNAPPDPEARMDAENDAPCWRHPLPNPYRRRAHRGLLDVLTWSSRRLTLVTEENAGEHFATGVYVSQGDKIDPDLTSDPLAAHRQTKKGIKPLRLSVGRALWRDATVLMQATDAEGDRAPLTFRWAMAFARDEMPEHAAEFDTLFRRYGADAFGLVNDQAKSEMWRHTRFPLYRSIFLDTDRQAQLKRALDAAENQLTDKKKGLRPAMRTVGDFALSPPSPGDDAYPNSDTKAVSALAQSFGAEPRYWAALEAPFFAFLARLADADTSEAQQAALHRWGTQVYQAAEDAFDAATASFDTDARHLRAVAKGRTRLRPIASLKPAAV